MAPQQGPFIIRPEVRSSSANTAPCAVCRMMGAITFAERRCSVMESAPDLHGGRSLQQCPNRLCRDHDTEATIMGQDYPHLCPYHLQKLLNLAKLAG